MSRIIYTLGSGHSGSTVFGMMMTSAGTAIALGEVGKAIRMPVSAARQAMCSCGTVASNCPFWGLTLDRLSEMDSEAPLSKRYEVVVEMFDRKFGPEASIIDSTKQPQGLAAVLAARGKRSVEPILVAKDVRCYAISALENIRRKQRRDTFIRNFVQLRFPEFIFQAWYRRNRDGEAIVKRLLNRAPFVVSYELLCLNRLEVARRIAAQLGEPFIASNASPETGESHIIKGNRMRLDHNKMSHLSYDYRWFFRDEWVRPYNLMPWVRSYNRQLHAEEPNLLDSGYQA